MRRAPLQINLIRCKTAFGKKNIKVNRFILGVTRASERKFVYDKIAIYDKKGQIFRINVFKLIQWLSRGVRMTGNVMLLLERFKILQVTHEKNSTKRS